MSFYVYSTATNSTNYALYKENSERDLPVILKSVLVKGCANLPDEKTFITPRGAVTKVSAEDMAWLKDNYAFQEHQRKGFLSVTKIKTTIEKGIKGLIAKDASAPRTPDDPEFAVAKRIGQQGDLSEYT